MSEMGRPWKRQSPPGHDGPIQQYKGRAAGSHIQICRRASAWKREVAADSPFEHPSYKQAPGAQDS